jgi:hypothetical protein
MAAGTQGLYTVKNGIRVVARDLAFPMALKELEKQFNRKKASKVTIERQ